MNTSTNTQILLYLNISKYEDKEFDPNWLETQGFIEP